MVGFEPTNADSKTGALPLSDEKILENMEKKIENCNFNHKSVPRESHKKTCDFNLDKNAE